MNESLPRRRLLPASMMARRLRVTVRWLREQVAEGLIPCVQADKQLLFDAETVERLLLERARGDDDYPADTPDHASRAPA